MSAAHRSVAAAAALALTPEQLQQQVQQKLKEQQALLDSAAHIERPELCGPGTPVPVVKMTLRRKLDIAPAEYFVPFPELEAMVAQMRLALLELQGVASGRHLSPDQAAAHRAVTGSGSSRG